MDWMRKIINILLIVILVFSFSIANANVQAEAVDGVTAQNSDEVPDVCIKNVELSKEKIKSGDNVITKIMVANKGKKAEAKNITITATVESEFVQITDKSDSVKIDRLKAGENREITFNLSTKSTTPSGAYYINLVIDYADKDGNSYSASGNGKLVVGQQTKVNFDSLIIDSQAKVGDSITASVNAMNFGNSKLCNVRAKIRGDGLKAKGTLYIGDIEPGQMGSGSVEIQVSPMKKSDMKYGVTKGTVTYYYETEFGKKKKVTKSFSLKIKKADKDDKKKNEDETEPTFQPKIIVDSYKCSKKNIYAGEDFNVEIVLKNTNKSMSAENMMITAGSENESLQIKSKSDSVYIDNIPANGRTTVKYNITSANGLPTGQYTLNLTMSYADKNGNVYDTTGQIKLNINQKTKVQFDELVISDEAEIGDVIEASINAMNLGNEKVKNVRAQISGDGLRPQGTIFVGDIEAGQIGNASANIDVVRMKENGKGYGTSNGIVTYFYENEKGEEETVTQEFQIAIKELSISQDDANTGNDTKQWWIAIVIIVVVLAGFGIFALVSTIKRKNG